MPAARSRAPTLLYPTLALYRQILRAHTKLPVAHRELGDAYVREEFRAHRGASAAFLVEFERQWRDYLQQVLRPEMHDQGLGREMTAGEVAALNDEQKVQLLKIRENAVGPAKLDGDS